MNCHSKIKKGSVEIDKLKDYIKKGKNVEWIKVHHFPDYAYFNVADSDKYFQIYHIFIALFF